MVVALPTDEFNWESKEKQSYFNYEQRKQLLESIHYVDLVVPEERIVRDIQNLINDFL